jgi:predicted nucleic acid-binding protein
MKLVIDASVFASLVRPQERFHAQSRDFVRRVQLQGAEVICPSLVLPECAAAIARQTQDDELVTYALSVISSFPSLKLVAVTTTLAEVAVSVARQFRLRSADSVYVAVATQGEATFVTWDNEVVRRFNQLDQVMTPDDWLAANPEQ